MSARPYDNFQGKIRAKGRATLGKPSNGADDTPAGDTDHAVDFLRHWKPKGPWLLSAIDPDTRDIITQTHYDEAKARAFINAHQGKRNLYFSVNLPDRDLRSKAAKKDIAWATALHVDVDVDPRPGFDLAAERNRILLDLQTYEPAASVIIDSGGGYSAYWRLTNPIPATDYDIPRVESRNLGLAQALGGDHCHNIDRIMRLPGSLNLPDSIKRGKGRTVALARVITADWSQTYALADFEPAAESKPNGADPDPPAGAPGDFAALPDELQALIRDGEPVKGKRSEAVWHVCCALVRAGWDDASIAVLLLNTAYQIGAHVRDQKKPAAYANRQAQKARKEIAADFDTKNGRPIPNSQRNIRLAAAKLDVTFSYNAFADRMLIEGPDKAPSRHLEDADADTLYLLIAFSHPPGSTLGAERGQTRAPKHTQETARLGPCGSGYRGALAGRAALARPGHGRGR
jgi:hypothetical protein